MADTTNTPEAVAAEPGKPASAPNAQPVDWESEANPYREYKNRLAGLQGKYETTANELKAIKVKSGELEESLKKVTGDKEVAGLEVTQWQQKYGDLSGQLETVKAREARTLVVATKFADLLPFLGDGKPEGDLLPHGAGEEELIKKLTTFREAMKKQGVDLAREMVGGATPPAAPDTKPKTASEYWALAMQAQATGKMTDYDAYYTEFLKAKNA